MLSVSNEFLQAVKNRAAQDIRLEFADGSVIGKADIAATSGGLTYTEILNGDTDMTFGRAVMSELSAVLVNADGRFTNFNFEREFTAKIGVGVSTTTAQVVQSGATVTWTEDDGYLLQYSVYSATQIRYNRKAPNSTYFQTLYLSCSNAVSLIIYGNNIYAIGTDYQIIRAWERTSYTSHKTLSVPSEYPAGVSGDQVKGWADAGTSVRLVDGTGTAFEYVPLGVFKGERPEKVRGKLIEFVSHDRMSLFDKSAESFTDGLTFPCTLGEIFTKLCSFCGVGYVSAAFPNSDKSFATNPLDDTDYTCREVLGWIAEAAGSYARMSRDGAVELVWFSAVDYTVTRKDRFEMTESEFETPPIDRLEVYSSYGDQLNTSGTGDVVYGITDNPFLYIENDTQIAGLQPYADAIYDRIVTLPAYQPSSFRAEWNPAVQCGDIITVVDDYDTVIAFPVFVQTVTWTGYGKVTYENSGGTVRQNVPFQQRELERIKKKMLRDVDLKTYVDSYLNSEEGVAAINAAVEGNFVTEDQLTGFVTTTQLDARIEAYINGEEGVASITESLIGTFVTEDELGDFVTSTEVSTSITQSISQFSASLKLSASVNGNSSTITLTGNGISAVSATMEFSGFVTYTDLASAGKTTINGANITTGQISAERIDTSTLRAQQVYYYDEDEGYFSVLSSEISGESTVTRVGPKDIRNDYLQALELYGSGIWFVRPGHTAADDGRALLFDMDAREIIPATDDTWDIGTESNSFNRMYLNTGVYLYDDDAGEWTRLYIYNGSLSWRDAAGDRHTIV